MKKTIILYKQTNQLNIGHIYEHSIVNYFRRSFLNAGYFRELDYDLDAEVLDGIIYLYFETDSNELYGVFCNLLDQYKISDQDIKYAINQISCEYESIPTYEFNSLKSHIEVLADQKWMPDNEFNISKKTIAENWTIDNSPIIRYIKDSDVGKFDEFAFVYNFNNIAHELKPLCAYVAQSIALSQIDSLYKQIDCYDIGDEWAEYPFENNDDLVGYAHNFIIPKELNMTSEKMQDLFNENLKNFNNMDFSSKLCTYLQSEKNKTERYFKRHNLFKYTGAVIGVGWFDKYATVENINLIIKSMDVSVNKFTK